MELISVLNRTCVEFNASFTLFPCTIEVTSSANLFCANLFSLSFECSASIYVCTEATTSSISDKGKNVSFFKSTLQSSSETLKKN